MTKDLPRFALTLAVAGWGLVGARRSGPWHTGALPGRCQHAAFGCLTAVSRCGCR